MDIISKTMKYGSLFKGTRIQWKVRPFFFFFVAQLGVVVKRC